jgi:hypothetical protein
VLNPHLRPKKSDQSAAKTARRKGLQGTLEIKKGGFASVRGKNESNSSREKTIRLNKIEMMLTSLLNRQQQGPDPTDFVSNPTSFKSLK